MPCKAVDEINFRDVKFSEINFAKFLLHFCNWRLQNLKKPS
jgi:hypothetical protein